MKPSFGAHRVFWSIISTLLHKNCDQWHFNGCFKSESDSGKICELGTDGSRLLRLSERSPWLETFLARQSDNYVKCGLGKWVWFLRFFIVDTRKDGIWASEKWHFKRFVNEWQWHWMLKGAGLVKISAASWRVCYLLSHVTYVRIEPLWRGEMNDINSLHTMLLPHQAREQGIIF